MTKKQFFSNDESETTFINRIIAFLNIPFDRVRIVGIVNENRRMLEEEEVED